MFEPPHMYDEFWPISSTLVNIDIEMDIGIDPTTHYKAVLSELYILYRVKICYKVIKLY